MWPCVQRCPSKQIRSRSVAATRARTGVVNCQSSRRLEELRASGRRLKQQGGDFHVAARRNLRLRAIQFEDIHGTVCDDLLVLGGD